MRGLRRVCESAEEAARLREERCRLFGIHAGDRRHQEAVEARAAADFLRALLVWFDGI
jgi:hypothetical protein